jgi:hypothetical protein
MFGGRSNSEKEQGDRAYLFKAAVQDQLDFELSSFAAEML